MVGKGYQIKISDFGTDNEAYSNDYYKVRDLSIRHPNIQFNPLIHIKGQRGKKNTIAKTF